MQYSSILRILGAVVGLVGVFIGSPWIVAIIMILLAVRFRAWEILVVGVMMDFIWLPADLSVGHLPFFTIGALLLLWGLESFRKEILVYS
ncbi:hypothetical protein C4585_01630 [Candidatus Parcubacteria bacterium]|nr:MAG: hypothetical protein C4585_01630 [Candidatus Parcubacteria bacterium]